MGMRTSVFFLLLLLLTGCKEKYDSPVKSPPTGYLVIEGAVNSGEGNTVISLSRTTPLDNRSMKMEPGAVVRIEGEDNSIRLLADLGNGQYTGSELNLDPSLRYRLRIITNDQREYVSGYEPVRNNPPIDSISWVNGNDGVQLFVNTHDPENATRYYQWSYEETWEYHPLYISSLKYDTTVSATGQMQYEVVYRDPDRTGGYDSSLYFCWHIKPSSALVLGSTAKLSKDEIHQPLIFIPRENDRLSVLYSVKVRQLSWSSEGYGFLQRMLKNTEKTGSIFDAQPSELVGNFTCVDRPDEPVIGYLTICPVQEKRIFIDHREVIPWPINYPACYQDTLLNNNTVIIERGLGLIPTMKPPCMGGPCPIGIVEFLAAPAICVDCQLQGGTNIRPSYWP